MRQRRGSGQEAAFFCGRRRSGARQRPRGPFFFLRAPRSEFSVGRGKNGGSAARGRFFAGDRFSAGRYFAGVYRGRLDSRRKYSRTRRRRSGGCSGGRSGPGFSEIPVRWACDWGRYRKFCIFSWFVDSVLTTDGSWATKIVVSFLKWRSKLKINHLYIFILKMLHIRTLSW